MKLRSKKTLATIFALAIPAAFYAKHVKDYNDERKEIISLANETVRQDSLIHTEKQIISPSDEEKKLTIEFVDAVFTSHEDIFFPFFEGEDYEKKIAQYALKNKVILKNIKEPNKRILAVAAVIKDQPIVIAADWEDKKYLSASIGETKELMLRLHKHNIHMNNEQSERGTFYNAEQGDGKPLLTYDIATRKDGLLRLSIP